MTFNSPPPATYDDLKFPTEVSPVIRRPPVFAITPFLTPANKAFDKAAAAKPLLDRTHQRHSSSFFTALKTSVERELDDMDSDYEKENTTPHNDDDDDDGNNITWTKTAVIGEKSKERTNLKDNKLYTTTMTGDVAVLAQSITPMIGYDGDEEGGDEYDEPQSFDSLAVELSFSTPMKIHEFNINYGHSPPLKEVAFVNDETIVDLPTPKTNNTRFFGDDNDPETTECRILGDLLRFFGSLLIPFHHNDLFQSLQTSESDEESHEEDRNQINASEIV